MNFFDSINNAATAFKESKPKVVRIIGNFDADGITATAILTKALYRKEIKTVVSIIKKLSLNFLDDLKNEQYTTYFFLDIGSNCIKELEKKLNGKQVYILDHHSVDKDKTNFTHINPNLYDIDGTTSISAAGVAYLFSKVLDAENKDLAHLAIIGAIGDVQENNGFTGINEQILHDAVDAGTIEIKQTLTMYGVHTKPLYKVLQYSTNPYIPNVTGKEEGALNFLHELGIQAKIKHEYRKITDLEADEIKKLVTGILLRRMGSEGNPADLLGPVYFLKQEPGDSPTREAKEYSSLLNACGKMNKPSLGVSVCIGDRTKLEPAIVAFKEYQHQIIEALNWFYKNRNTDKIIEKKGYAIIIADDFIRDAIIGTLCSLIARSNVYEDGTIVVTCAHTIEDDVKLSMRLSGLNVRHIDLSKLMKTILSKVDGVGGGHPLAAGALVASEQKEKLIEVTDKVLGQYVIEETV